MPEVTVTVTTDLEDPTAYTPLESVGRVHEVGINGQGYMLFDGFPDNGDLVYRRSVVPLDPQRFATTATPFSEAVERYVFTGWRDWSSGGGQRFYDLEASDKSAFFDSKGIDPFTEPGALKLRRVMVEEATFPPESVPNGYRFAGVADGERMWYVTGAANTVELHQLGLVESATAYTGVTGDITGLTYGDTLYVFAGTEGVFTPADVATAWSTVDGWFGIFAGDRVCMASGADREIFTTLAADGTEEVPGGRYTAPSGFEVVDLTASERFVYFVIDSAGGGRVLKWEIGTADAPSVAAEFSGQRVRSALFVSGQLVVRTQSDVVDEAGDPTSTWRLYRCPLGSDGNVSDFILTLEETEAEGEVQTAGRMATDGRFVWFPWDRMHGADSTGLGVLDLATGGYAKGPLMEATGLEATAQALLWGGRPAALGSSGVFREGDAYLDEGWLEMSVSDQSSGLDKVYDEVTYWGQQLASGEELDVEISTDLGLSYTTLDDSALSTVSASRKTVAIAKKAKAIGVRVYLRGPGTSTPKVNVVQVKQHPMGLADLLVQVPVNCFDQIAGLNGARLEVGPPGVGAARARTLEALAQTRVLFQDVDWASTEAAEVYEVVSVDVHRVAAVFDKRLSRQVSGLVAVVTLRKAK